MMRGLQRIDRRRNPFHPSLELERKELGVVARLMQFPPCIQSASCCVGFHMLRCSPSWAGILRRIRPQSPHLADLVGHRLAAQVRHPAVHRSIAGRVDDDVCGNDGAVRKLDASGTISSTWPCTSLILPSMISCDAPMSIVVARAAAHVLHEQARAVDAEIH